MLKITPAGQSGTTLTANRIDLTLDFDVPLATPCRLIGGMQPQYTLTYTSGQPVVNDTTAFVPITAVLTLVQAVGKCGCAKTKIFTETFNVSFQDNLTASSVSIASEGRVGMLRGINCNTCGTRYGVTDSVRITLTA